MKAKIRDILNQLDILTEKIDNIENGDSLLDYGLRSINIVFFIKNMEKEFGFEFSDDDMILANFRSINDVERLIKKYMQ